MRHMIEPSSIIDVPFSFSVAASSGGGSPSKRLTLNVYITEDGDIFGGFAVDVDGKNIMATTNMVEAVKAYNEA